MSVSAVRPPPVARFFLLTFTITYLLQAPAIAAKVGLLETPVAALLPLAMLGLFGPAIAAILVVRNEAGWSGVRALFATLLPRRLAMVDAAMALLLPAGLLSGLLLLLRCAGREGPIVYPPLLLAGFVRGERGGGRAATIHPFSHEQAAR